MSRFGHAAGAPGAGLNLAPGEPVSGVERRYVVEGDMMLYDLWMALDHVELANHLHATLRRT